jgi:integration host factor subunit alpha
MTLTKADFAEQLYNEAGFYKREAKHLVDQFFEEIKASLARGEPVKISGFGNYGLRDKPARPGRNPKTGEEKTIAPRRVVTFRPGRKLNARIDKATGDSQP